MEPVDLDAGAQREHVVSAHQGHEELAVLVADVQFMEHRHRVLVGNVGLVGLNEIQRPPHLDCHSRRDVRKATRRLTGRRGDAQDRKARVLPG